MSVNVGRTKRYHAITCANCEFSTAFGGAGCRQCADAPVKRRCVSTNTGRTKRVVIDLCSSSEDESSCQDEILIFRMDAAPVAVPASPPRVEAAPTDNEDLLDAAQVLCDMSFGDLPPLTEKEREFMNTAMAELLFSDDEAAASPVKPRTRSQAAYGAFKPPAAGVRAKSVERVYRTLGARRELIVQPWNPVAQPSPLPKTKRVAVTSTDGTYTEDSTDLEEGVTECLTDLELSDIAREEESEDEGVDDQERAELLEFVRNIPSRRITRRQQRLVRASLMTWHFDCL